MKKLFFPLLLLIALLSCEKTSTDYKYFTGELPDTPVNFEQINTEFDDYNSTAPTLGETFPLCFSSTRNSNGDNYDIIYKLISIGFSKTAGELSISENTSSNLSVYIENANLNGAINKINSSNNELGPYLIPLSRNYNGTNINGRYEMYILVYSNNEDGNQDIKFTENKFSENYEEPKPISFLNTKSNEAYFTLNKDYSKIYFTSDREGSYNIYSALIDNTKDLIEILSDSISTEIKKEDILSSEYDDKCPFIINNTMVFVSNRTGGYGGFDLYYSEFLNGEWSAPTNFGDFINTEYDEYRPIIRPEGSFKNDFMLFSSNRPGGKGGFDLYYVGVEKVYD